MPMPKRTSVDDYFAQLDDVQRPHLEALRALSADVDPEAREVLKWNLPVYVRGENTNQWMLQNFKHHCSLRFSPEFFAGQKAAVEKSLARDTEQAAARAALPVVAFDAGGIKDWLLDGQNGLLIPWMDRAAFAAGLDRLLQDKALAKTMGEAGLKLVSERYDFESYIGDLETMFGRVAAEKQRT